MLRVSAQENRLKKANKDYEELAFPDATSIYLKIAESGFKSEELFQKLGNNYYFNAKYADALKWYAELLDLNNSPEDPIYLLRYSQTLKALGHNKESEIMYNRFQERILGEDANYSTDAQFYLNLIADNSNRYTLQPLTINTDKVEFGATVLGDKLIYTAAGEMSGPVKRIHSWTNEIFYDFYQAKIEENGNLGKAEKMPGNLNSRYNESSVVFTKDGNTAYFTRNNTTPKSKKVKGRKDNLKIYRATKVNDKWKNIEDLSINSDIYSNAHPALSPDERSLFFASNMPGSLGQTDIFMVEINADGSLSEPENLGPGINTRGRESFPFVSGDQELYFSSDGHFGLGSYDVFYVDLTAKTHQIINLGKPINSSFDDFAFWIDNKTHQGYFSSNRQGGKGQDDIYRFTEIIPIKKAISNTISGKVTDEKTGEPQEGVTITFRDMENNILASVTTDESGSYTQEINRYLEHRLVAHKNGFETTDKFIAQGAPAREVDFSLKANIVEIPDKIKQRIAEQDIVKILSKEEPNKVKHIDGIQPGYFLIANVYSCKSFSNRFMRFLEKKGLSPKSFYRSQNNYYYVYLERYDTLQEARKARDSKFFGKYLAKTWILEY
ncbi:carboxypeptidase-like regulatory domain-containing protein [Poritiphilus flavus]|uniref:carboxypeptidase-like regulatory domain-containing protein n=1 Tax=Poritiphilus flavus TaxID=2697053 RepID=UPI0013729740|nr:carboxypeptidase-like regulatory domain-containing protein [Poritiphilus flavus]